jgi:hypothetical protein
MKLYVTHGSPYARLARIIVIERALEDRVEIIQAKTRTRAVALSFNAALRCPVIPRNYRP